ncbi:hypothetical protein N7468_000756 [Penicillium chermesinum]|uniref:Uncharacterized protein n=1 Tax=Penicillium chermesinum TaxID=63820 RepID=A0A9W9TZN3_9EURO|nr:uncharacterized protein N7468_000756 [Penicillium chermesinum]KAJ5249305.1 hypothetical protein N7468_000756 [Penicillium chermesinum]
MNLDAVYHLSTNPSTTVSDITSSSSVTTFLDQFAFNVIPTAVSLAGSLVYLSVHYDIYYAFVVAYGAICYLLVTFALTKKVEKSQRRTMDDWRKNNESLNDPIHSWLTVTYLGDLLSHIIRYDRSLKSLHDSEIRSSWASSQLNFAQGLIMTLWTLCTVLFAGRQVIMGGRPLGGFTSMVFFLQTLKSPIEQIFSILFVSTQSNLIHLERLVRNLHRKPEVIDKDDALSLSESSVVGRVPSLQSSENQGGGKSTLLRLIFRLYDVTRGSISVDGHNITDLTCESLRSHIGIMSGRSTISNGSVIENLRRAKPGATKEEIIDACKRASLHECIMKFSEQYEALLGKEGHRLSDGEAQRLEIARLLLKSPSILLLDEPTSALDAIAEQNVVTSLKQTNATIVMTAHRLSTIKKADQILVMYKGEISECGTHQQLFEKNGYYTRLCEAQTG